MNALVINPCTSAMYQTKMKVPTIAKTTIAFHDIQRAQPPLIKVKLYNPNISFR